VAGPRAAIDEDGVGGEAVGRRRRESQLAVEPARDEDEPRVVEERRLPDLATVQRAAAPDQDLPYLDVLADGDAFGDGYPARSLVTQPAADDGVRRGGDVDADLPECAIPPR
jgi:hypothetical protein